MSTNLIFNVVGGNEHPFGPANVDFPFQTPTSLTYAVLDMPNTESRIGLLSHQLEEWGWTDKEITEMLRKVETLLNHPNLELSSI